MLRILWAEKETSIEVLVTADVARSLQTHEEKILKLWSISTGVVKQSSFLKVGKTTRQEKETCGKLTAGPQVKI